MDLHFYFGILCSLLPVAVSTMYNFDVEHTLHRADEDFTSPQTISNGFVFFGVRQTQLFVCHRYKNHYVQNKCIHKVFIFIKAV